MTVPRHGILRPPCAILRPAQRLRGFKVPAEYGQFRHSVQNYSVAPRAVPAPGERDVAVSDRAAAEIRDGECVPC
jgi:hypothetical protein